MIEVYVPALNFKEWWIKKNPSLKLFKSVAVILPVIFNICLDFFGALKLLWKSNIFTWGIISKITSKIETSNAHTVLDTQSFRPVAQKLNLSH